jgi:hypothetical protein
VLLTAACGAQAAPAARTDGRTSVRTVPGGRVLDLDFEQTFTPPGAVVARVENTGSSAVVASVVTSGGGRITRARGFDSSSALRFPAYRPGTTPAAVLLLWDRSGTDRFSPAERPFVFGADVELDEVSSGSPSDNGDNVVQRGLSADTSQYKLQLDRARPSCRVAGSAGVAFVKAPTPIRPGVWYRVSCRRSADTLLLDVRRLGQAGPGAEQTVAVRAPTGSVTMARGVPVSVGGKTAADGKITTSSTDQFNGLVDNVLFELQE